MQSSLSQFEIRNPGKFFIGGQWVSPQSTSMVDQISPVTEEVYFSVAEAGPADVDRAVAAARSAFDNGPWPRMSHHERAAMLQRVSANILARKPEIAMAWSKGIGLLHAFAPFMVDLSMSSAAHYLEIADTFPFVEKHETAKFEIIEGHHDGGQATSWLAHEPVGVVAAIVPWNAPFHQAILKIVPALLAGCTVILKAPPETPLECYIIAEAIDDAGLPAGAFNFLTADRPASEHLVRNTDVDKVTFTGSTAAGRRIASICGERIARVSLELGGKSAAIIYDDYDIEAAAASLVPGITHMSGQMCAALSRVVVSRNRRDALVEAISSKMAALKVGDNFDPTVQMGPLGLRRQRDRVEEYIAIGKAQGARVATGGGRPAHLNRGFFIEPTVFDNVERGHTIAQEEIFGPVLSVIAFDTPEEAVAIANDSIYGLNGAVFTNDIELAYRTARAVRTGNMSHNEFKADTKIAFGGFKQSGLGREGGIEGLRPFLESKTILMNGQPSGLA